MSKIYVMAPFTEAQTEQLKQLASAYQDELFFSPGKLSMSGLGAALSGEKEPVSLSEVDAVIGNVPAKRLQEASAKEALRLSWMQLNSSGADAYVKEGILPANSIPMFPQPTTRTRFPNGVVTIPSSVQRCFF